MKLHLDFQNEDDVTIVYCRGRVTYRDEAAALSGSIAELLPQIHQTRQLVLDLSGVEMIDSAGLGELVALLNWIREEGGAIKLASPHGHVRRLLELTNLSSVFEIHPSLQEAVVAFRGQPV